MMTPDEALQRLDALRTSLLDGDLTGLEKTVEAMSVMEQAAGYWTPEDLARVRRHAIRTHAVLGASAAGVKSVRRRMAEITTAQVNGGTYGADGSKPRSLTSPTRDARA